LLFRYSVNYDHIACIVAESTQVQSLRICASPLISNVLIHALSCFCNVQLLNLCTCVSNGYTNILSSRYYNMTYRNGVIM